jgi:hypothetical protein
MSEEYLDAYEAWAMDICPNAVTVIPDMIGGALRSALVMSVHWTW